MDKETISKVMSSIAKLSHQKSPRNKEHFKNMQKKSVESRNKKKISTV